LAFLQDEAFAASAMSTGRCTNIRCDNKNSLYTMSNRQQHRLETRYDKLKCKTAKTTDGQNFFGLTILKSRCLHDIRNV